MLFCFHVFGPFLELPERAPPLRQAVVARKETLQPLQPWNRPLGKVTLKRAGALFNLSIQLETSVVAELRDFETCMCVYKCIHVRVRCDRT